jgi:hypothetical protein
MGQSPGRSAWPAAGACALGWDGCRVRVPGRGQLVSLGDPAERPIPIPGGGDVSRSRVCRVRQMRAPANPAISGGAGRGNATRRPGGRPHAARSHSRRTTVSTPHGRPMAPLWERKATFRGSAAGASSDQVHGPAAGRGDPASGTSLLSTAITVGTATLRGAGLEVHRERRGTRPAGSSGRMKATATAAASNPTIAWTDLRNFVSKVLPRGVPAREHRARGKR